MNKIIVGKWTLSKSNLNGRDDKEMLFLKKDDGTGFYISQNRLENAFDKLYEKAE